MENKYFGRKAADVQALTKLGHEYLSKDSASEATETFLEAYQLAKQIGNEYTLRGCKFNLGACYVATGNPKTGLKYLEQAVPPEDCDDGPENFADLWYNIGIARHALSHIDGAIIAYKKAYDAYKGMESNNRLEAECLSKLAVCFHLKHKLQDSHDMYTRAQEIYRQLNDKNNEALCLVSETGVLSQMGNIDECARTLNALLDVCQQVEDKHLQAKIYHDIGLLYISEKLYESAAECLEQALLCIEQSNPKEKHLQATVLQNIGAVCNYMKLYDKAIYFHQNSADIYGELGDRKTQTKVFNNLAYAYTQIENYTDAITAFQHAIQAAKDSADKESQCLATEGIAAIWFRLKQYEKAVICYKEAMRILTLSSESDMSHADRIVDKLADAIQYQLNKEGNVFGRRSAKKLATASKDNPSKGKKRFSDSFDRHRSLIARGLDPKLAVDSSEDSPSDESLIEDEADSCDESVIPSNDTVNTSEKTKDTNNSKTCVYNNELQVNSLGNNSFHSNYYEQPVLNNSGETEIRRPSEYVPHVKRTNSKMCMIM